MFDDRSTWGLIRDARAPLLGRDAELGALELALDAVEKLGEARIVLVVGPAGVGKTRLFSDLVIKHRVLGKALTPRIYRGSARESGTAFGVFGRLLRARFGLLEGMDATVAKEQLRAQVALVMGDAKVGDVAYFLGQFLGLSFDESPLTRAVRDDPQQAEHLRRVVLKAFFEADARNSPVCLVFEDLHAAGDDALGLLRYLVEYLHGPILVVCLARPELFTAHEDWSREGEPRRSRVELGPLKEQDAVRMMEHLLAPCARPGEPVPRQLVDAAVTFAGGIPLLLEQMVRLYHDTGVLEEETELGEAPRWRVDLEKLEKVELPVTIEDAVNQRINALEPQERALLEQGAAMGSVFWSGAFVPLARAGREAPDLWAVSEDRDVKRVQATLAELVERDYLLRLPDSTFPGSEEYIFKHNKEREAVKQRTLASAAKRHHRVIADWLDHQPGLRENEEYVAMLAEHREKGGDGGRAGLAYLEAGDVARRHYASSKACDYFAKGLALLGDAHAHRRIDALHDHGDVLLLLGRVDDALAAFREMLTLAYQLDLLSKGGAAHNRIGRLYRDTGALEDAGKHLETALALFQAAGDERGIASSIDDLGKLRWLKGEYDDALALLRDGLARRRKLGDRRSIALSLNNLGLVLEDSGEFKQALEAFEQALGIRQEIGDLVGVVVTLNNIGTIAQDQRDFDRALGLFEQALEVAKQIGDRNRTALLLTNMGECQYRSGRPGRAIELLKEAEGLCDELGDKLGLAEALRGLGKAYLLQNDLAKAREHIGRAVDRFAALRSKVHLGIALRTLGEITAAGGWGAAHTKSAREYFARSAGIFEQTGNEVELARTFKVYARFLRTDREFSADEAALREADRMERRADAVFSRLRISSIGVEPAPPYGRDRIPSKPAE
jgi:tetratricopeptide (TPR) repeat protein